MKLIEFIAHHLKREFGSIPEADLAEKGDVLSVSFIQENGEHNRVVRWGVRHADRPLGTAIVLEMLLERLKRLRALFSVRALKTPCLNRWLISEDDFPGFT